MIALKRQRRCLCFLALYRKTWNVIRKLYNPVVRFLYMDNTDKYLAASSAIFISLATVGFLVIPQFFDTKITKLNEETIELVSKQRGTLDYMHKANNSIQNERHSKDHLEILRHVSDDNELLIKMESKVLENMHIAALDAINAGLTSGVLSSEDAEKKVKSLESIDSLEDMHAIYLEYFKQAPEGIEELNTKFTENSKRVIRLASQKNRLWYLCFTLQSLGMIVAIVALFRKNPTN